MRIERGTMIPTPGSRPARGGPMGDVRRLARFPDAGSAGRRSISHGGVAGRVRDGDVADEGTSRRSLAIALTAHAAILALASLGIERIPPRLPSGDQMEVTMIGSPPGDPDAETTAPSSSDQALDRDPGPAEPAIVPAETSPTPSTTDDTAPAAADPAAAGSRTDAVVPPVAASAAAGETGPAGGGGLALGARVHGGTAGLDANLMASVGTAIAGQVRACWNPPGTGVPPDTSSTIVVRYGRDGAIAGSPSVIRNVGGTETPVAFPNEWERAAVGAIERCSPIGLPASLYPYWREVEVQIFSVS